MIPLRQQLKLAKTVIVVGKHDNFYNRKRWKSELIISKYNSFKSQKIDNVQIDHRIHKKTMNVSCKSGIEFLCSNQVYNSFWCTLRLPLKGCRSDQWTRGKSRWLQQSIECFFCLCHWIST